MKRTMTLMLLAAAIYAGSPTEAATIRIELSFDPPTTTMQDDGSVFLALPDCVSFNDPGMPLLPACPATVLLPPGEHVTAIRVLPEGEHLLEGSYLVPPAQQPQAISLPGPFPLTQPDATVYNSDSLYPPEAARFVSEQKGWGHGLSFLRVFPVAYRPLSGELLWYERIAVEIDTALPPDADSQLIPRLRRNERTLGRLSRMVMNPEDLALYQGSEPASLSWSQLKPDNYPYVIITNNKFKDDFRPVADFHSSRGLRARTMTVHEIITNYDNGVDIPEAVRRFIIDAYERWGTEYVLLGGDVEVVKIRDLYNFEEAYNHIPGDCYYEGLDGTWNDDGDGVWGEPGEEDLVAEIIVGRAPVNTEEEIYNWLHKNEMYTEKPVVSQIEKALFIGELLNTYIWTWGDDYVEEIKEGSDACGFTTVGYPTDYDKRTLYDRDGTWDKFDLIPLMNEGFAAVHHAGHASRHWLMRMEEDDLAYLTNDGVNSSYMLNYSLGCYAGALDWMDSICEDFVKDEHGSAAFVCNSRYGFYAPGTTCGYSQDFARQFTDARFGEGIVTVGRMNVDAKIDLIWKLDDWMRYIHYELNLLGDPALPQWSTVLGSLDITYDGKYVIGQDNYRVTVTSEGTPVPDATVTLYSDDFSVWVSGETDDLGIVQLNPGAINPTTLYLKAIKADYLPATGDLRSSRR